MATITGTANADVLYGTNGSDALFGLAGDDTFFGSLGTDFYFGDAGIDTVIFAGEYGSVTDSFGNLRYTGGVIDLTAGIASFTFTGPSGSIIVSDLLSSIENVVGTLYDDQIYGSFTANSIYAHNGDDYVSGLDGDDRLFGEDGNDALHGGKGNDLINGGNGSDTAHFVSEFGSKYANGTTTYTGVDVDLISGQARIVNTKDAVTTTTTDTLVSIENLVGTLYDDNLRGNDVANSFYAHNGNDILDGRGGNDRLFGEAGNDVLYGGAGNDYLHGGAGTDQVMYHGEYGLTAGGVRTGAIISLEGGYAKLSFASGIVTDTLVSIENVVGTLYNDTIIGDAFSNSIYAHNGNDSLYGRAGNDRLFGEAGNDRIFGGAGNDLLTGGDGADRFIHAGRTDGVDTIADYCRCEGDVLDLAGAASRYRGQQVGDDVVVRDVTTGAAVVKLLDYTLSDGLLIV